MNGNKKPPCVGAQGGAGNPQKGNEMKITTYKNGCTESVMELTPAEFMELVQMGQRQQLDAMMAQFLGGLLNGGDGDV